MSGDDRSHSTPRPSSAAADPADVIAVAGAREAWDRLLACVEGLGDDVRVRRGPMEVRAEVAERTLCRLVPYRELVHVLVGDSPAWETRVRTPDDVFDAADRIVTAYLRRAAESPQPRSR